jgi:hypothetical protein
MTQQYDTTVSVAEFTSFTTVEKRKSEVAGIAAAQYLTL